MTSALLGARLDLAHVEALRETALAGEARQVDEPFGVAAVFSLKSPASLRQNVGKGFGLHIVGVEAFVAHLHVSQTGDFT